MAELDILASRQYFTRIGLWPVQPTGIRPQRWLDNFSDPAEREFALALLDSFLYINSELTDQLFVSAFHNLSAEVCERARSGAEAVLRWTQFRARLRVTHPTGETPNATDSGYMFDRKARMLLEVDQGQIMAPEDLVELMHRDAYPHPLVFVDDFAGSGDQFLETWKRPYELSTGDWTSIADETERLGVTDVFYAPAVCTSMAADRIAHEAPRVRVRPAHVLTDAYSAAHPDSLLVPAHLAGGLESFVASVSTRVGIHPDSAFGYKRLGLAIAFEHSVPDATLPLFWMELPGWTPLRRRR